MGCGCNKNKNTNAVSNSPNKQKTYAGQVSAAINKQTGFLPPKQKVETPVVSPTTKAPSLLKKALNLGEAVANHVADGMSNVSKEQIAARLSVCHKCPFRAGGECTKCGCVLAVKAAWKTSACPEDRWPKIEQ